MYKDNGNLILVDTPAKYYRNKNQFVTCWSWYRS